MDRRFKFEVVLWVLVIVAACIVAAVLFATRPASNESQPTDGISVEFDGHTLNVEGAFNVVIGSSYQTRTWGGTDPVTQTTSSVTVTIYLKTEP